MSNKKTIEGIIFDMDGTISDTNKLSTEYESRLFKKYGINISPDEITRKYSGNKTREIFQKILKNKNVDIDKLLNDKWEHVMKIVSEKVLPIPGAIDLVNRLRKRNYPIALASSSSRKYVELILHKLNILDRFVNIVTGDDVDKSKPNPTIFFLAAEKLGIAPEHCLVFEDSMSGMIAAKRAGMRCAAIVDKDDRREFPADFLVNRWVDLDIDEVLG